MINRDVKIAWNGVRMTFEQLQKLMLEEGIQNTEEKIDLFRKYLDLLIEWSERMNLTAIKDPDEIIEKHFYDCLVPMFSEKIHGKVCDVGSGAGFPGMVWKIVDPSIPMTLLEPTNKRCQFLNAVIRELGLQDIEVVNQRAEDYVKEARESYDFVTARAVANLQILSELCIPLVKVNGQFVAMKGMQGEDENKEALSAITKLGAKLLIVHKDTLPSGDQRVNLFYTKSSPTPGKYPRAYSQMKKKPLK